MKEVAKLKILFCGPPNCGRETIKRLIFRTKMEFDYKLTVGVDILTKEVTINDEKYTLSFWDIATSERFSRLREKLYYKSAGMILVFDPSQSGSWKDINKLYSEIRKVTGDIPLLLIGNCLEKTYDLGRGVARDAPKEFAQSNNGFYIETETKESHRIEDAIHALVEKILNPR